MTDTGSISEARRLLLEKFRRGELQTPNVALERLVPRPLGAEGPISPDLEQLWFHDRLCVGAPINNESFTIHRRGPLDTAVLERCFQEIARRHEIWRSAFPDVDGTVVQRVEANVSVTLPFVDLNHLSIEERETESRRIATEDARRPFDLNVAPLFRLRLVRWAEDYHRIYLTAHRLVFDCPSIERVLIRELAALYRAFSAGQPSPLPALGFQYTDYAEWKQRHTADNGQAAQMEYWRQKLSQDLPSLELPTDRPRPATPTWASEMETCAIPAELSEALQELGTSEGLTPYMILLATFQVLLYRYSGQNEIVIGGKTNTRTRREFEPLLGSFVNTIVFRNRIEPDLPFRAFLQRVKGDVLGSLAHSDLPFDIVLREVIPERDPTRHPLFQVLFSMRAPFDEFADGWELTDMEVHCGASGFDLFVEFAEHADPQSGAPGWAGRFVYSTDLFDRATILGMLGHFQTLLRQLVLNPDQAVSENRNDTQVGIRGFRIDLGEIEAALLQSKLVDSAAALWKDSDDGGQRIVAYVVPTELELDVPALRLFLRERLPEHMIPSNFVALETLPKTASGQLAKKALLGPEIGPEARREYIPPADEIEERLTNIWQELLGLYPVSVNDNYFDLGGHSMLALRLFNEIKFCFQLELPLGTLLYAPTVRTLAAIIREAGVQAAAPVVPIQPNGAKPPIFCIGALNGEVILFRRLALELGPEQPLFGLQPFSLVDRLSTVEKLAASYIEQLQLWGGPRARCLVGYSFGGLVAIEMARQMRKSGIEPPMVALIDTNYRAGSESLEPWKDRIRRYRYHVDQITHGARGLGHLRDRLRARLFRVLHKVSTTAGVGIPRMNNHIFGRQLLAGQNYRAKPYPGPVLLFVAESRPEFLSSDTSLGWRKYLSDLRVEAVPGDHGTINTGSNLKILARKLNRALEESPSPQAVPAPAIN